MTLKKINVLGKVIKVNPHQHYAEHMIIFVFRLLWTDLAEIPVTLKVYYIYEQVQQHLNQPAVFLKRSVLKATILDKGSFVEITEAFFYQNFGFKRSITIYKETFENNR